MRLLRKGCFLIVLTVLLTMSVCAGSLVVERQVYEFLTQELELPTSSACGILANIEHESDFNISALGDNGTSFGLFQWHNERYTALKTYCRVRGLEHGSVSGQLEYLKYELETDYIDLLNTLRAMEDTQNGAYGAAYLWCIEFERPSDMENKAISRGTLAKGKYWSRYHNILFEREEQTVPTPEYIQTVVEQGRVTIPQPPEEITAQQMSPEADGAEIGFVYLPRLVEGILRQTWGNQRELPASSDPGSGFAAILFAPLSDGKKERFCLEEPQWELQPAE